MTAIRPARPPLWDLSAILTTTMPRPTTVGAQGLRPPQKSSGKLIARPTLEKRLRPVAASDKDTRGNALKGLVYLYYFEDFF